MSYRQTFKPQPFSVSGGVSEGVGSDEPWKVPDFWVKSRFWLIKEDFQEEVLGLLGASNEAQLLSFFHSYLSNHLFSVQRDIKRAPTLRVGERGHRPTSFTIRGLVPLRHRNSVNILGWPRGLPEAR